MSQIYTIQNEYLSVSASAQGAELMSIKGKSGTEFLWQGDPVYWTDRSPVLFPYVGRLTEGRYMLDGNCYPMQIHGIALYLPFSLVQQNACSMCFELRSDASTKENYPREFVFRIHYRLEGSALWVDYEVENRDAKPLYFGLGGHPGFQVPLEDGKAFEDYRLRFSEACAPTRVGFSASCLRDGSNSPYPLEDSYILPLKHTLFDEDAIVLSNMAREVTLETADGGPAVTVSFPQMPYLGIWHMPKTDAPYVCIEPWCSLPAWQDRVPVLEEQKDLLCLQPGEQYTNSWTIRLHNP